jgi:hypothetical protein
MNSELQKDMEGNGRGLIWGTDLEFSCRDWETPLSLLNKNEVMTFAHEEITCNQAFEKSN